MSELTEEQKAEIWRRRKERALRWKWSDGSIAPGYPTVGRLEDENEATLNAMPPIEPASHKKRKKAEEES